MEQVGPMARLEEQVVAEAQAPQVATLLVEPVVLGAPQICRVLLKATAWLAAVLLKMQTTVLMENTAEGLGARMEEVRLARFTVAVAVVQVAKL